MVEEKRQPCATEITPEMIRAGADFLRGEFDASTESFRRVAEGVFEVMIAQRDRSSV
jgi:hypothetical protein